MSNKQKRGNVKQKIMIKDGDNLILHEFDGPAEDYIDSLNHLLKLYGNTKNQKQNSRD